jgi:hypothetical protein
MINLGFLTEGKLAAVLITPSSWGSQRAGYSPRTRTVCYTPAVAAALADFSAAALAAVATSQAFREASSLASRDAMRALAVDKASVAQKREKKVK